MKHIVFLLAVTGVLSVSCKTKKSATIIEETVQSAPPTTRQQLSDRKWKLIKMGHHESLRYDIFINFSDSSFGGKAVCNSYGGKLEFRKLSTIRLTGLFSTEMACDGLETEQEFFSTLQHIQYFNINGDTLWLSRPEPIPPLVFINVH